MRPGGIKGFRSGESGAVHSVPASLTRFIGRESLLRLLLDRARLENPDIGSDPADLRAIAESR